MMPGNNLYHIEYLPDVVRKDVPTLPKTVKSVIKRAIEERLKVDPVGFGKPLRYSRKDIAGCERVITILYTVLKL